MTEKCLATTSLAVPKVFGIANSMIRPSDFAIEIGTNECGTFVRVEHKQTGNKRVAESVPPDQVGATRDRLIRELKRELYQEEDIRFEISTSSKGEFVRVIHLPTGLSCWSLRKEQSQDDLLDKLLEEVFSKQAEE